MIIIAISAIRIHIHQLVGILGKIDSVVFSSRAIGTSTVCVFKA
jgi:hypothetical protein